ncbi:MAG: flavin reductase family protein [Solirubrobacteraceae bacterium]
MDSAGYRAVIGHFATGVAVITAEGAAGPGGMTANALCSLSLDPLLLLVCFENTARTLPIVREAGRFGVNILSEGQSRLSRTFASKRGEQQKFEDVGWERRDGVPVLDGTIAWLTCELRELLPAGDHTIGIGAVIDAGHAAGGEPLVWYRGRYGTARINSPHRPGAPH